MIAKTHPQAVLVYTNTFDHRSVVETCARRGVHVMMEKPLAVSLEDAMAIEELRIPERFTCSSTTRHPGIAVIMPLTTGA